MKYDSPVNNVHTGIIVEYHRTRTGPNFFMVFYKNLSTVCFTRKEVRNRLGTARFTETSKILSEWVDEMIDKYGQDPTSPDGSSNEVLEYAKTAGFGPEAHDSGLDDTDPNHNTRTII